MDIYIYIYICIYVFFMGFYTTLFSCSNRVAFACLYYLIANGFFQSLVFHLDFYRTRYLISHPLHILGVYIFSKYCDLMWWFKGKESAFVICHLFVKLILQEGLRIHFRTVNTLSSVSFLLSEDNLSNRFEFVFTVSKADLVAHLLHHFMYTIYCIYFLVIWILLMFVSLRRW